MKAKLSLLFVLTSFFAFSQERGSDFADRVTYGGNIGLMFGTQTIIDISPRVGYYVSDQFIAGLGVSYKYFRIEGFSDNMYGGSIFGRYFITEEVFIHTETEMTNLTSYAVFQDYVLSQQRRWINTTMVGGGYRSGPFILSLLYIINHNPATSPYGQSPIVVQGGIMF